MNKLITLFLLIIITIVPNLGEAVVIYNQPSKPDTSLKILSVEDLNKFNTKAVEEKIDRKLKLKEKIILKIIKAKTKNRAHRSKNQANELLKIDGFAIAGLSTSLVGFIGLIVFTGSLALFLTAVFGVVTVILSMIALKKIKHNPASRKGKTLAITGLFLGSILLLFSVIGGIGFLI